MAQGPYQMKPGRRGVVYILALIMMVAFMSLGAVLSTTTLLELQKGENLAISLQARLAAESGLEYMLLKVNEVRMPTGTTADTLIANLGVELEEILGGTGDVGAGEVITTADTISVPEIVMGDFAFTAVVELDSGSPGSPRCRITVTGRSGPSRRQVSIALNAIPCPVEAFKYGIASKGSIRISGNATIEGVNTGQEATLFSMSADPVAIEAGGHATIGGDIYVTNDSETSILLTGGGLTVAGETDIFEIIAKHAHFGVEAPEFPEIDITPFTALTTGLINAETPLPTVLNNIRIKANTNPQFTGNTTINGVLVIESPNTVVFTAGTTINGVIVCLDNDDVDIADKQIEFRGHVMAPGVGALPDTEEFAAIKAQVGTVVLAPGFAVTFRGATNSINGTIVADEFAFRGNSNVDGDLSGSIIGLSEGGMTLSGNATIRINRETAVAAPAGFKHPIGLVVAPGTYTE